MRLSFDSIEEVKEFVTNLKGTRGKKGETDGETATGSAPAPMAIPQGGAVAGFNPGGFAPQAASAGPMGGGFPVAGAAFGGPSPEIAALVQRIIAKFDSSVAAGAANVAQALPWFIGECGKAGVDATNATMDQMKTIFLPKMPAPALDNIAKLMGA
jgi:hypothetical protein